jgi:serine/threonine protein phosphatase PrpC
MIPGIFAPAQNLEGKWAVSDTPSQTTSDLPASLNETLEMTASPPRDAIRWKRNIETIQAKSPLELGLESAAAFFGMPFKEPDTTTHQKTQIISEKLVPATEMPTISLTKKVSAPIKVSTPPRDRNSSQNSLAYNRRHSEPDLINSDNDDVGSDSHHLHLHDFTDDDGHLWRSKYCVLEEGILYFYRNPQDAQSAQAVHERRLAASEENSQVRKSPDQFSSMDLSKSPMTRNFIHQSDSAGNGGPQGFIWEKRVYLNSVGSVRSAEQEYGMNSFQLDAVNEEENDEVIDTLILKARNQDDMKEWIFQFHRSLSSFMRNFLRTGNYLDIAYPILSHQPSSLLHSSPSEIQLQRLLSTSPKFPNTPPLSNSLSHGHGRTTLHRRRQDVRKAATTKSGVRASSLPSSPETNGSNSPQIQTKFLREPSPNNYAFSMSPVDVSPPERFLIPPVKQQLIQAPELSAPQSNYPEMERPKPSTIGRYVPPHLRKKQQHSEKPGNNGKYMPPHLRNKQQDDDQMTDGSNSDFLAQNESLLSLAQRSEIVADDDSRSESMCNGNDIRGHLDIVGHQTIPFKRGGCADPDVVDGSIMDPIFIPRKASILGPVSTEPFGCFGGGDLEGTREYKSSLRWETGAVSECGIRNSNEDAYLVANDLLNALQSLRMPKDSIGPARPWNEEGVDHHVGLFAVFDGHCGNQGARFAVEKLAHFIFDEIVTKLEEKSEVDGNSLSSVLAPSGVEQVLREAIIKLDDTFCHLCQEDDREWESGATAIVAVIANENLVMANLGDCRGVLCRFVEKNQEAYLDDGMWNELDTVIDDSGRRSTGQIDGDSNLCFWKEITNIHCPSAEQEKARIENANGWVTTETEIPIGQLRRMDFLDEDVIGILQRCFNEPDKDSDKSAKEYKAAPQRILEISRVCGELAVSRALGDRDFKAAFNKATQYDQIDQDKNHFWDCPLFLPYPDHHDRCFRGDLVSNTPDFQHIRMGEDGISAEFLLLACDGLWDVLDADDAVRVTSDLLFRKNFTAKRAVSRHFTVDRLNHL